MMLTGFSGLDGVCGGLQPGKNYLVYGDVGLGKTTFSLQFLYQGLLAGETVALISRRPPQTVFDHGAAFGMDLEAFAGSGQLIILEYLPKVVENATRLRDDGQIWTELRHALGRDKPQRMVLDPVTPLMSSSSPAGSVFRARLLLQSIAELHAAALFMFDTPEGQDSLTNCKDFAYGVLRFEASAEDESHCRLVVERLPGVKGRGLTLEFEVSQGVGLVESAVTGGGTAAAPRQRSVMVVDSETERRTFYNELVVQGGHSVAECVDASDALVKVAGGAPDLVVIEKDLPGIDGVEFCRKLRQNKINVPIILISDPIRRSRDRVEIMAAGADECLERPVDGRILKIKIENLLRRYDASTDRISSGSLDATVTTAMERDKTTSTTNLTYFYERIQKEVVYAGDNGLSFAVLVMRLPDETVPDTELAKLAGTLVREYDIVYGGRRMIAVLLAETDERGIKVFLKRFAERWVHPTNPVVQYMCMDRRTDSLAAARNLIEASVMRTGPGTQPGRGPSAEGNA